ncbi:MAG: selenobiotic family peptide radical SAM maturase [Proteobacteria bacterium]|nr:selenobiotic family peptide radical SAM maturase [Desulfobacula sp.]MBU3950775.1 selenobiotic family peptide radical SAM maturase [Pseudomonadota bacterium]MBU4133029.1 selenobiotic family peptide radical SAM maturase [Pseudomonadota bacterium]
MPNPFPNRLIEDSKAFTATRKCMDDDLFRKIVIKTDSVDSLVKTLGENTEKYELPAYFPELVAMEGHVFKIENRLIRVDSHSPRQIINPGLMVFSNTWQHLAGLLNQEGHEHPPKKGNEQIMVWPDPMDGSPLLRPVTNQDLLALKMTLENIRPEKAADLAGTHIAAINGILLRALEAGILLGPKPGITRSNPGEIPGASTGDASVPAAFKTTRVFALQWHITQACDLHCRHCYDRMPCEPLTLSQEIAILDSLYDFCSTHNLFGQVSFTGGNPLLHPNFHCLYQEASDRGFFIGVLGNPATQDEIASLIAIQQPSFYQVSLEGLEAHNDHIRGSGHFQRVLAFLEILRQTGIYSKIMLTLTRDNLDQVIPLGHFLQSRTDLFTFNRLSPMGEGANLIMADPDRYKTFLKTYMEAVKPHTAFDLKENLFNILLHKNNAPLFGGCTGYGCGAAFNFVSVLATGQVHACRKFPSPIGDITRQSLTRIYHSDIAARYRKGPDACRSCRINPVCRGCMAAAHSWGLDVFTQKDPYCFFKNGS